jgi:hypothetical protein
MRITDLLGLFLAGLLGIPGVMTATESGSSGYQDIWDHYEAIRLALLEDSLEDAARRATAIEGIANELLDDLSTAEAGVDETAAGELAPALRDIEIRASELARSSDLASAREGFFALTQQIARQRKLAGPTETVIAYCPMAQKAWIQPAGEIGNPYMGQKMPKCGEVVGE